ncbi:biogenesis of lysosome-related organelles complex 1 subunit 6 isoform X2 [Wyeomyia smithii]|uniref:biogenesis of lysosome-related organelles complex 1 subunit 6 isoform X2 n=1 Tax=Wyeomyia smithii TaxID=174621 RepID=UPI00246802AB|nr:biogenesis of lysosome-related organelles complex 1 subunit 6 isoform X2 [Wyeomyia smithii]
MSQDIDFEGEDTSAYSDTVKALSSGLLQIYEPTLNEVKADLSELLNKQEEVQKALEKEKQVYSTQDVQQINEMVIKIKYYREKAIRIKTQMHQVHQRTKSLRGKALDMQELKVNQCASKLQQLHYEESLVANNKRTPNKKS